MHYHYLPAQCHVLKRFPINQTIPFLGASYKNFICYFLKYTNIYKTCRKIVLQGLIKKKSKNKLLSLLPHAPPLFLFNNTLSIYTEQNKVWATGDKEKVEMVFGYYRFVTDQTESRTLSYKSQQLHLLRFSNTFLQENILFLKKKKIIFQC